MSIYSGFGMRKMEEQYNKLVGKLILLLQSDILKYMSPHANSKNTQYSMEIIQQKQLSDYKQVLSKLQLFEQHKYLEPKFSQLCVPLKNYINLHQEQKEKVNLMNSSRKVKSEQKSQETKDFQLPKQFVNISSNACQNFLSQNSIKKFNQKMTQFSKQFKTRFEQFTNKSINKVNSDFQIFTIQEEFSQHVSPNESIAQNKKLIQIPVEDLNQKMISKKMRIYKSNQKQISPSKSQNDTVESCFPSYRRLSTSIRKQKNEIRNLSLYDIKNSSDCEKNPVEISQFSILPNETLNLQMSQTFTEIKTEHFKKIRSNSTARPKPTKKVQKSQNFVDTRYKKLIDHSQVQKLLLKKHATESV